MTDNKNTESKDEAQKWLNTLYRRCKHWKLESSDKDTFLANARCHYTIINEKVEGFLELYYNGGIDLQ